MKTRNLFFGLLILVIMWPAVVKSFDFQQISNSGTTENLFSVTFTDLNTGYAVGNNGTIVKTTNTGTSWSPLYVNGISNFLESVFFIDINTGFVVGMNGIVLRTTNAGANWSSITVPTTANLSSVYFANTMTGFAAGGFSTYIKTTNGGSNWTLFNVPLNSELVTSVIAFDDGTVLIGINNGSTNLMRSTNWGTNWINAKTRAGDIRTNGFANSNGITYMCGTEALQNGNFVAILFKSTDKGLTWTEVNTISNLARLMSVTGVPNSPNIIYTVGYYDNDPVFNHQGLILKSFNGGATVTAQQWGSGTLYLNGSASTATKCTIVGTGGLILQAQNPIGIQPISSEVPKSFALGQNYPNPFNPTTNIKFDVKETGNVTMYIFNTIGQVVTTLVNENLKAGSYKVDFNANSLSSGVYFYRMVSKNFTDTKKMVLVK